MKESKLKAVIKHIYFRWLFKKINGFLYVGSLNKALYKHYGVKDNKLVFAPHSIDTERFREAFQAFPKPSNKKFTIGFVGKFIDKKNPLELVEAVAQLNHKEAIHLKWIGDGPLRHELEKACKQHNLSFEFTGFLNQSELIEKGYANLDLMVLPSAFNETWGLVVNEVYCGNIPVITSDKVGCAPDMVEAVSHHLVYPSGQPEKLTSSIEYAIANHKVLQEKVTEISKKFSIQNTLSGYLEAINQN